MDENHAPRHLADPPAPPSQGRPSATTSRERPAVSSSIEVPRRVTEPSGRDASLFQELLRSFGEMRERMIAAESKVEFLSELLPEIWARMASQEATAQSSQRSMAETTKEARVQAAQASIAAERSQQTVDHLRELLQGDEDARRSAVTAAEEAKGSAHRAEVLAARLEEQIRSLAAGHGEVAAMKQEIAEITEKYLESSRRLLTEGSERMDGAVRGVTSIADAATAAAREVQQETRLGTEEALRQMQTLALRLNDHVEALQDRMADEEMRRAEQSEWGSELRSAVDASAQDALHAAEVAREQAALMELREQAAAAERETTMRSVENIMRSARETFVASRDAGDEVIAQAREAAATATTASNVARAAAGEAAAHAELARDARSEEDVASARAIDAADSAERAAADASRVLEQQRDMASTARQMACSAEDARSAAESAAKASHHAEEAARAAAGEAARVSAAEADRLLSFESSVGELRSAGIQAIEAAETARALLWQMASDETGRNDTLAGLAARYDKDLRSLEGAVQSARGAARTAQEASRSARQASEDAEADAAQAAQAAARSARSVAQTVAHEDPGGAVHAKSEVVEPDLGGAFWASDEHPDELLLESEQDVMWVERFRRVWSARGRRAAEEDR
jgi:hypothetical protein